MNSRRALKLAFGMAVLTFASAASATTVTTDALAVGTNPTDTLLNYPLLGGPDSQQITERLLEEQLGHYHENRSSRGHGHGNTIGQNGQGNCGANSVSISTRDSGHNVHRGKNRFKPLPPSPPSCPPPGPAGGGDGIGGNVPPGGNDGPTGNSGSDSSGLWLSDAIVVNAPTPAPEPGTFALLALGLGFMWLGKRPSRNRC